VRWAEETLVLNDGSLFTVRDGNLELRGRGWERRRRKGDTGGTDRARICRFGDDGMARKIAEMVAEMVEREDRQLTELDMIGGLP
jgi:hypothetical protein